MKNILAITIAFLTSFCLYAQYPACDTVPLELVTSEISFSSAQFGSDSAIYIPIINKMSAGFAYPIAKVEMLTPLPTGMTCINCDWNVFGSAWPQNDTLVIDMNFNVTDSIPDNYTVMFDVIIMNLMGGGPLSYDTCKFQNSVTLNLNPVIITGINEQKSPKESINFKRINIYPNPVTNSLVVQPQHPSTLTLYNSQGQLLLTKEITTTHTLNTSHLSKGIYFLKATSEKGVYSQKVIKQ